jgi:hypothetical protein
MLTDAHRTLSLELSKLKQALRTHEAIRSAVFAAPEPLDPWASIRAQCPNKVDWQIFDHCAGFTRLYAIYEQFISDLISEYLSLLPELHPIYATLPDATRIQHRVAVGQILQKWSESGRFQELTEVQIVSGLANGLSAAPTYHLLVDAFLIDPQNYRGEVLRKLFGYLGFADCWSAITKFPQMIQFINDRRDATETAQTILHDIVEYRNQASHTGVTTIAALDEMISYADFIVILSAALEVLVKRMVWRKRISNGQAVKVATVLKLFGRAIGVSLEPGKIAENDELIVVRGDSLSSVAIRSIKKGSTAHQNYEVAALEEIGLVLTHRVKEGAILYRLPSSP